MKKSGGFLFEFFWSLSPMLHRALANSQGIIFFIFIIGGAMVVSPRIKHSHGKEYLSFSSS